MTKLSYSCHGFNNRPVKKLFLLLVCLICIFGCSLGKPELTRRYTKFEREPAEKFVVVSAFTMDQPPGKNDMPDSRSLSALISAVGGKAQNIQEMRSTLADLGLVKKKEQEIDKTTFRKRIVFAVDNKRLTDAKNFGLADRINALTIKLAIGKDYAVRFASWDKFVTEDESVDLGKDTLKQSLEAKLATSVGPIGAVAPVTVSPTVTASRTLEEEVTLKQRRIKLSGRLFEGGKKAELRQEGAIGRDLTGTFIVDVEIRPEVKDPGKSAVRINQAPIAIFSLPKETTKPADEAKPSLEFVWLKYLDKKDEMGKPAKEIKDPITCDLKYDYVLRHAKSDLYFAEGKHEVVFYEQSDTEGETNPLILVEADEIKVKVYRIKYDGTFVSAKPYGNILETLNFLTLTEARIFLKWLQDPKHKNFEEFKKEFHLEIPKDLSRLYIDIEHLNYK